jgi:hypothetical protein
MAYAFRPMANPEHLKILHDGVAAWNTWRRQDRRGPRRVVPDLSGAVLAGRDLRRCDLSRANLWQARVRRADLRGADLSFAQVSGIDLSDANLSRCAVRFAVLSRAKLVGTILRGADLRGTSLRRANLRRADLTGAILRHASLAQADVAGARLAGAELFGAGLWGLIGEPADQSGLVLQPDWEAPPITVDDLDTAQFLFLLLDNPRIADVIETASSRTVLLLGRFTPARKRVLDAIKTRLLARNFVPVLFDFAKPSGRDLTETVASLAHMACFVIAALTGAKSIPQELSNIVPYLPSVPVVPLIGEGERTYAMFEHFIRYQWVLEPVKYRSLEHLLSIFDVRVLRAAYRRAMLGRGVLNPKLPRPARQPSRKPSPM